MPRSLGIAAGLALLAGCSAAPAPRSAHGASAASAPEPVYVAPPPPPGAGDATETTALPAEERSSPAPVQWGDDIDAALAESRADGRHVLVLFSAAWAEPSRKLQRETLSAPAVRRRLNARYHAVEVDLTDGHDDRASAAAKRFRADGLPLLLVLDSSGRELDRMMGYIDPEHLLPRLR